MVTVVDLEGGSWTVQQRRLVAATLDVVQPDDPPVTAPWPLGKRHVPAGRGTKGEKAREGQYND